MPGLWFPTPRWEYAAVEGVDADGEPVRVEGEGVFAQMLQHETDHLGGTLCHDRMVARSFVEAGYVHHYADLGEAVRRLGLSGDITELGEGEVVLRR